MEVIAKEAALEAFKAEFTRNGYNVPQGLIDILEGFSLKPTESPEQGRARIYRRLWGILWFGSGQKLGASGKSKSVTYVYPSTLKRVIRAIVAGDFNDRPDPQNEKVYKVNIGDLASAKWPVSKKPRK
ncbi:hypothetical protein AC249_AIPGENE6668 [Exaiptasia diaphana]|nr:hypothetical protein AC249_AIPGENE6668 [Exaiptasia diaphana]